MTIAPTVMRSLLFAPGNDQHKLDKAPNLGADAVVYDLEDAVPNTEKHVARQHVFETLRRATPNCPTFVRITDMDGPNWREDLDAAVTAHTAGVVVPKVERPDQIAAVVAYLDSLESAREASPGQLKVLALIETAAGVENVDGISRARHARLMRLILGTVDLAADLGLPIGRHNPTFDYAAARLVMASRASGLRPPLDGPYTHLDDQGGYREDCHRSAVSGMAGRVILHPAQVEGAHEAYSMDTNLDWHRRVVAAFESAQLKGVASIQLDQQFIDYPVYAASRRALEAAADG